MGIPIADAAKVFFTFTQDLTGELWLYGFAIAHRDATDWDALIDALETSWVSDAAAFHEKTHLVKIAYSEWGTSGFTGWHQMRAKSMNHAGGSGNQLPPQCAVVGTLLNVDETAIQIRRRRGRIYFGQIPASFIDGDGVLTTTGHDAYAAVLQSFQDAVNSVPASGTGPTLTDGICVASPTDGQLFQAQDYGVGKAIDTQRRRRQKRPEAITYAAFT